MFKQSEDVYDLVKLRRKLMKRAGENYYNLAKRNSIRIWDGYFSSKDFLYLRKDREFATEFLQFISESNRFKESVWQGCIHRNLSEWKRYWLEPEMETKFTAALESYAGKRGKGSKGHDGTVEAKTGYATFKPGYTIAFVLIIIGLIVLLANSEVRASDALIMVFAILLFPMFIFQEHLSEQAFLYVVLAWAFILVIFFVLFIWGILYALQNGFNKETRKTFFHTVRLFLLIMLAGMVDAICYSLTGFSVIMTIL